MEDKQFQKVLLKGQAGVDQAVMELLDGMESVGFGTAVDTLNCKLDELRAGDDLDRLVARFAFIGMNEVIQAWNRKQQEHL